MSCGLRPITIATTANTKITAQLVIRVLVMGSPKIVVTTSGANTT